MEGTSSWPESEAEGTNDPTTILGPKVCKCLNVELPRPNSRHLFQHSRNICGVLPMIIFLFKAGTRAASPIVGCDSGSPQEQSLILVRSEPLPLSFRVLTSVKVIHALIDSWWFLNNGCRAVYDMLSPFSLLLFSSCCAPLIQGLNEKLLMAHPDHPCLETEVMCTEVLTCLHATMS